MAKEKVGLYLGSSALAGAVVGKNKIVAFSKHDFASLDEEAQVENLNEEVKWEALINKVLRDMNCELKDINISLSDREFIFRSFDLPMMKKSEIESSLIYEIEKYIPFKLEELRWDYDYVSLPKEKKVNVTFVGVKESSLKKVEEIFNRLGLAAGVIEPASLSLLRFLKTIKQYSQLKNFALLDFSETEAYLTFFYNDLPVFNRYFLIPSKEEGITLEKVIEPVHLSFQYFAREFKFFQIEKLIIVKNVVEDDLYAALKEELQIDVEKFSPKDFTLQEIDCIENFKAAGIAGIDTYPYKFKPVFAARVIEPTSQSASPTYLQYTFLAFLTGLGILAYLLVGYFLGGKLASEQLKLYKEKDQFVRPSEFMGFSFDEIKVKIEQQKNKIGVVDNALSGKIAPFLEKFPFLFPNGLWLKKLDFSSAKNKRNSILQGAVYLNDSYQERLAIDEFISNLRDNDVTRKFFTNAEMISSERSEMEASEITLFSMKLE